MKKLLFALLILPMIGFSQACQYGSSTDASELCDFFRGNNFTTNKNADIALNKILSVTGMSKRFVLKECNDISNCLATSYKGIRYILYDIEFMDAIATNTNSWSSISILAHEIGHHINGHSLDLIVYATGAAEAPTLAESRQMELEADEYSGFVMYRLGASLHQAQEAVAFISDNKDDSYSTHPAKDKRLAAIKKGYNNAKSQGNNSNTTTQSSPLTAEDYFYLAYNNESDYKYQVDNYTKCLGLNPDNAVAYSNRGVANDNLGNHNAAIADCSNAIRIDPNNSYAYNNRGAANANLGNHNAAIADYTSAIRIDPEYASPYHNRGITYAALNNHNAAIADFTSAIRIDPEYASPYTNRGVVYANLGNYDAAITDYTSAIRIDPDDAVAYSNRGVANKMLGNYNAAIADYTRAIKIEPEYASPYINRGNTYAKLNNYNAAIADYTSAIRIDPELAIAYKNRGIAKANAGASNYCSDYKIACDLGHEESCEQYYKECK